MDADTSLTNLLRDLSTETLLLGKALEPLPVADRAELARIQTLDLTGWTEADVREEIIAPIVRMLGYRKGDYFSVDREKSLAYRDSKRRIDYAGTLFRENFWLIEAKKPLTRDRFSIGEIDQALGYAVHPQVNAALMVLTDGDVWEIFDRETSLSTAVVAFHRRDLLASFDQLRALLGPWQAWFFEKRRVLRLVDRVFDHEVNLGRVEEYRDLIERRVQSKRMRILDNFRAMGSSTIHAQERSAYLSGRDVAELVDVHLHQSLTGADLDAVTARLVALARPGGFNVLHHLLEDLPRNANDLYWPHAVQVLIALEEAGLKPNWLPAWLGSEQAAGTLTSTIEALITHCLTCFEASPGHRAVLIWDASARRQFKILAHIEPGADARGRALHALNRFMIDETAFAQLASSPEGQMLGEVTRQTFDATARFARSCRDERGRFKAVVAAEGARAMWRQELRLLEARPDYLALVKDRDLGDLGNVEASFVIYDQLAHNLMCVIQTAPRWRDHVVARHREVLTFFAEQGYWSARKLLGLPESEEQPEPDGWSADRFFFGDREIADALAAGYGFRPTAGTRPGGA